jgi:hypothetical protein
VRTAFDCVCFVIQMLAGLHIPSPGIGGGGMGGAGGCGG